VFPEIVTDDVLFATFCPRDGHADPVSILNGFVSKARAGGATFREHARVTGIDVAGGRVRSVRLDGERIPCATVVNATGAWAAELGRMVGLDVPIQPLRRQIFVTAPLADLAHPIPLTVEFSSSLYMHRESGGVLLGMADPSDAPGYVDSVNWEWMSTVVERGLARLPILEKASIRAAWAGLYEDTPDKHPILGTVDGVEGFVMAAGFSGHGVMHSPATGELIAELITDGKTSLDITALRLARFERGELVPEHNVI
jgi:sarcosine oxidase subunit beta